MTFTKTPHQFKPGRRVWVRPAKCVYTGTGPVMELLHRFDASEPFEVTAQIMVRCCPHYLLLAPDGAEWQVAQLEVSDVPLRLDKSRCEVRLSSPVRMA